MSTEARAGRGLRPRSPRESSREYEYGRRRATPEGLWSVCLSCEPHREGWPRLEIGFKRPWILFAVVLICPLRSLNSIIHSVASASWAEGVPRGLESRRLVGQGCAGKCLTFCSLETKPFFFLRVNFCGVNAPQQWDREPPREVPELGGTRLSCTISIVFSPERQVRCK